MPIALIAHHEGTTPQNNHREINGVPIWTKRGTPRTRFSFEDKLKLLGCTKEDLEAFADLMAPKKKHFAITRARSGHPRDWTEGRGLLTPDRIARHLMGNRLPGVMPLWIAPRAWDWTRFVAIDVDLKNDRADFEQRCRQVENVLEVLDVKPESQLVVPTPSGGRHYYFFTNQRIRTAEIAPTLAKLGIVTNRGKFEVFPSTSNGLRLPFGHIPGNPHAPDDWINFIRNPPPGINWEWCKYLAEEHAKRHQHNNQPKRTPSQNRRSRQRQLFPSAEPTINGPTKAERQRLGRYRELLSRPTKCPAEIDELWQLGIREVETRHEAILRIAWNFVFVKGLTKDDAIPRISKWAYQTGKETSKDVIADLKHGTQKVERDIRDLVHHFAALRDQSQHATTATFSPTEVDEIVHITGDSPFPYRKDRSLFLLEFLRFAKSHGTPTPIGWRCAISAGGIMRGWPGCSGSRYKEHRDWAIEQGIIEMVREKRQTANGTGRPRTYLIRIPPTPPDERVLSHTDAIEEIDNRHARVIVMSPKDGSAPEKNDRYQDGLPPKGEDGKNKVSAREGVREKEKTKPSSWNPNPNLTSQNTTTPIPTQSQGEPTHADADQPISNQPTAAGEGPGESKPKRNRDERRQHPRRPHANLATGTPECAPLQSPLPELRDPPPGPQPTAPSGNPAPSGGSAPTKQLQPDRSETGINPDTQPAPGRPYPYISNPLAIAEAFAAAVANALANPAQLRPTAAEVQALPYPDDQASIAEIIRQQRHRSPAIPNRNSDPNPTWDRVEHLATQAHSCRDRWLLLCHPQDLPEGLLQERLRLLIVHRLPPRRRYSRRNHTPHHRCGHPIRPSPGNVPRSPTHRPDPDSTPGKTD